MTIHAFGTGDILALPKLNITKSSFGSDVHYTQPSYISFYSAYGFAVPLNYEAMPYELIMDDRLPKLSPHVKRFENSCDYLLISHDGLVWKVSITMKEDGPTLSQSYIERKTLPGWWLSVSPEVMVTDDDTLMGFLYTNPTPDKVDEYFLKYKLGERVQWFSISDIVETLHREFPLNQPENN